MHALARNIARVLSLSNSWSSDCLGMITLQVKMISWHGHNALVMDCCAHPFLPCSFEFANSQTIQQLELISTHLTASLVIDGAYVTSAALS